MITKTIRFPVLTKQLCEEDEKECREIAERADYHAAARFERLVANLLTEVDTLRGLLTEVYGPGKLVDGKWVSS